MSTSFADFITRGVLGELRMGLLRSEVVAKLDPISWIGRPPPCGPEEPPRSGLDVIFCYGGAAGIKFNKSNRVAEIFVNPQKIRGQPVMQGWSIRPDSTFEDIERHLSSEGLPALQAYNQEKGEYFLAEYGCFLSFEPLPQRPSSKETEILTFIRRVSDESDFPDWIRRQETA